MNNPESRFLNTCPVSCNAPLETTAYVLPEGALLRCSACGQLISQCTEAHYWESMKEFDDSQGTLPKAGSEGGRLRRSKKFLDQIAKLLGQPPEKICLLDVGCSSGAFLHAAVKLGFRAEGVEPAPKAAATAQAAGLKVHQGLLQEAGYADGQFDAITLFEVIEHLQHPQDLLQECRRILRPGGILLIGTGNAASWSMAAMGARWEYLSIAKHGGHVSFFSPESIALLGQRAGFGVAAIRTRGVRFCEKGDCATPIHRIAKLAAEFLNIFAALTNKGHDMAVYLKKI
jgi:2-polyprenyl-3-methyl-5-hydroxy-6-metoxy-1,4-benzoquinol methylase